jgi:hypothetical protein
MLYELIFLVKWLPKVTLSYIFFSLLNGMAISNLIIALTAAFDLIDYIPFD